MSNPTPATRAGMWDVLHNAARHEYTCPWSKPGAYNAETTPCSCHLAEDITRVEREARHDLRHTLVQLSIDLVNAHGRIEAALAAETEGGK